MIFNSYLFLVIFLPASLLGFWLLRGRSARTLWLVAAGIAFYGFWNWKYVPLLVGSYTATYAIALVLGRTNGRGRRLILFAGILLHLALLGYFKYANFFLASVGINPAISIILPLGISFSTFQAISYLVDVFRRTIPAEGNLPRFLAYGTLFANVASGPILRYREIKDDLGRVGSPPVPSAVHRGVMIFILGISKKVLIADVLADTIDPLWSSVATLSTLEAWIATLGYGLQLYFDFSGYSDMAFGLGAMFGLTLPQNFNSPYKALSPSDFWRRWHMTLGTWIRDYLYIPLGGSRRGMVRTITNLLAIMTLIGLWHGANWTFVIWGAYHGALLAFYHLTRRWWDAIPAALRRAATFLAVTVGWVFFRSPDLPAVGTMFRTMFRLDYSTTALQHYTLATILLALLITQLLPNTFQISYPKTKRAAILAALLLVACLVFINYKQAAFLYYQF